MIENIIAKLTAKDDKGASDLISYSQGRKNVVKCREETAGWRKHETADIE